MIIYKGYNVYPQPLEEILCSHPAVVQAAVVGRPSPQAGEIVTAFVVLSPEVQASGGLDAVLESDISDYVAAKVAPYQKIRALHAVQSLPLTATGKVLKSELRRQLR